ncbi:MAG: asparagine synthase (glutamine-hydrolyzing) [Saprospiraceae bacterium]
MCGIAGVFNLNGEPFSMGYLKKMAEVIAHRGPDGEGFYIHKGIALAHKRLSILDISEKGSQPMSSKNGEWIIIFNGCIYNFIELRQELKAKGQIFFSNTDTEVIVEGLSVYGVEFFKRMNGMFAIAAWNTKSETLYLSRDRFGVKPLYYWFDKRKIVFGSEVKAILQHPEYSIDVNLGALNEYFTFQNLFSYRTLFKNIFMLPPANTLKIDKSTREVTHQSWWNYDFSSPEENMSLESAIEGTKYYFQQAVVRQMISDVPVGSYLSGGMDSGSIASIASKQVKRLTTFTCGFDMNEVTGVEANYDERRDAERMASILHTEHYEQVISAGDIKWSLPRVVYHLEDLRVGMSYPNYYISRLASKFVKVCLQGTGGDELFGGYPWRYYRIFQSLDKSTFYSNYYDFWQRLVSDQDKVNLFQSSVFNQIDINEPRVIFERVFTFNDRLKYSSPEEHINNSLYFEIKTFLPGLLIVGDKLAMANGLEERFPFLDNDLVNYAQKIPIRHKLGNLELMKKIDENTAHKKKLYQEYDDGKNVLRKAMVEFLPKHILERKKQGFSAPDESWYRGANAEYVKDMLLNKKASMSEFISQDFVRKIVDEHINQRINHRLLIWSFLNFEWWCKIFLFNEKFDSQ